MFAQRSAGRMRASRSFPKVPAKRPLGRYPTPLDRAGRVADTAAPACEPGQEAAAPLCPEGAETPRGCHEMSCDVMFRRATPVSARLHPAYRSSIAFRSVRAAAGLPAARPCFARIACAHAPAFAPARFARLIARASHAQGAPVLSVPFGFFSHRCKAGDEAASGCRFVLSHPTTVLQMSSPYRELFHNS